MRVEVPAGSSETHLLAALAVKRPDAAIMLTLDPRGKIHEEFVRQGIPAIYSDSLVVEAGGLASLGELARDRALQAVDIVARILNGEPPASIPVDQLATFHLAVNQRTARAMGLKLPDSLLFSPLLWHRPMAVAGCM